MPACDWPSHKCQRPVTSQIDIVELLAQVVVYEPTNKLARYCQAHGERLATQYNDRTAREQVQLHHLGEHPKGGVLACVYCTPPMERQKRVPLVRVAA